MQPVLNNKIPMPDSRAMDFTGYAAINVLALHPIIQDYIEQHVPSTKYVMIHSELTSVNIYVNARVPLLIIYTFE